MNWRVKIGVDSVKVELNKYGYMKNKDIRNNYVKYVEFINSIIGIK